MAEDKNLARDVREVIEDPIETTNAALSALQARMWTAFPVRFSKFDKEKQTSEVNALIKSTIKKPNGKVEKVDIPTIKDAPVYFPAGGRDKDQAGSGGSSGGSGGQEKDYGYMMTFPIKEGDEGIAIVSCRSIDNWYDKGEKKEGSGSGASGGGGAGGGSDQKKVAQDQISSRMHDLSDLMILPGVKSKPRAKEVKDGVSDKGSEFRSVDGKHVHTIDVQKGLASKTSKDRTVEADKNIKNTAGENHEIEAKKDISQKASENFKRETGQVESAKAGKAIVKSAPKIFLNSS